MSLIFDPLSSLDFTAKLYGFALVYLLLVVRVFLYTYLRQRRFLKRIVSHQELEHLYDLQVAHQHHVHGWGWLYFTALWFFGFGPSFVLMAALLGLFGLLPPPVFQTHLVLCVGVWFAFFVIGTGVLMLVQEAQDRALMRRIVHALARREERYEWPTLLTAADKERWERLQW